ncbi:hypothetical protein [Holdemania massiliensis]|uniref:hypothetical protein n=1 Tax=Holdemania massiliensis TaxID=1468449 RepID=UPI001F05B684|nr:hypothetical protein [Holdemania massiliensis]MCH1940224.1 hypothetical protein [Holdemania massiliensis]
MNEKRMLVIPGGFVPFNDTVTLLSYKQLRNLKCTMDVIALKGKTDTGIEKELNKDPNWKKFNIEYVCDYDQAVASAEKKNVLEGIFNIAKYCIKCYRKSIQNPYELMYSSSLPAFTHLAAFFIKKKKKNNIKWIASFSDPLYKSPYKYDVESFREYSFINKIGFLVYIFIYMNGIYEKIAIKNADKLIFICEEQRDFMLFHYKNKEALEKKSIIIPLNYIGGWSIYDDLVNASKKDEKNNNHQLKFAHFGRIYGLRKIDKFLIALGELNREIANLEDKLQIYFYGELINRYKKQILNLNLTAIIKAYDKIPYAEAMKEMISSDVLLLFDTILENDSIQPYLPSKSLEYILLRKPLFILAERKSPTYRIFSNLNYTCTTYEVSQIKDHLVSLLNKDYKKIDYDITDFENEKIVRAFTESIDSLY